MLFFTDLQKEVNPARGRRRALKGDAPISPPNVIQVCAAPKDRIFECCFSIYQLSNLNIF